MYDQFVIAVAGEGMSDPFEDFDVERVVDCVVDDVIAPELRLLDVVFDLGRKTRRNDAVAPFLSLSVAVVVVDSVADDAVTVKDVASVAVAVVVVVVVVTVEGVAGGDVAVADAEDLRLKRFISMFFSVSASFTIRCFHSGF